jgi:hypothetical protein
VEPTSANQLTGTSVRVDAYSSDGVLRGYGTFFASNNHLEACDTSRDGKGVRTELFWSGATRATVGDGNGSTPGCGGKNVSIAEGTAVSLRVCTESIG